MLFIRFNKPKVTTTNMTNNRDEQTQQNSQIPNSANLPQEEAESPSPSQPSDQPVDVNDQQHTEASQTERQSQQSQPLQPVEQMQQSQSQEQIQQPQSQEQIQQSQEQEQTQQLQPPQEQQEPQQLRARTPESGDQQGGRLSPRRQQNAQRRHSRQGRSPQREQEHQSPNLHQQQMNPPTVLVVQQPIILGRGAYVRRGHPFMYRGVQLGNGAKIGMNCMFTLGVVGVMLVITGAVYGFDKMQGFFLVLTGAIMVATCLRLCHKAKHDFDALPQDHPDRVTYSSPIVLSREAREIASTTTTYQLPPGAQIINSSPLQGGHMAPTYQLPAGAQVISSTSTLNARLVPPGFLQTPGAVASSGSRNYSYEDKPPSYEEVCKNMQR